jgi:hypothetical protein
VVASHSSSSSNTDEQIENTMTNSFKLLIFIVELSAFCYGLNILYLQIIEPFEEEAKKMQDLLKVKETCDGCGKNFNHQIHDHFGYKSCSVDCDDFLNDVFAEMKYE